MRRCYKALFYKRKTFLKFHVYKLKYWNEPFYKKQLLNSTANHFWYFFDYLKTDKYYHVKHADIYKEESDFNLYFIKKTRKDYIKFRSNLLRVFSAFYHYYHLERVFYNQHFPITFNLKKILDVSDWYLIMKVLK